MKSGLGWLNWNHAVALLLVLALHGAVLVGLWSVRVIPHPADAVTLFVSLVSPPPPQPRPDIAPPPPKPLQQVKPPQRVAPRPIEPPRTLLAVEAPVVSPTEATKPLPPSAPVDASPESGPPVLPASPAQPAGPVTLTSRLSMICPERTPPPYPPLSRRLGETGRVVLRVELDETGRVSAAQVITSSGFNRLDAAALAAVRSWRCQPAQRDGQPVRSVAVQPFNFTLESQ